MTRIARQQSPSRIYNIGQKGMNDQDVFYDNQDRSRYLFFLRRACAKYDVVCLAVTLMSNHVHLILEGDLPKVELVFKSLGSTYVRWFNRKYDRCGALWNDRYYSRAIKDERQLLATAAYIFNNPVAARIVDSPEKYAWSSFCDLKNPSSNPRGYKTLDNAIGVQNLIDYTIDSAKRKVAENERKSCEVIPKKPLSERRAIKVVRKFIKQKNFGRINELPIEKLRAMILKLLDLGSNITQISRVTAISRGRIAAIIA
ncbi:MAG: transposase [Phoenicibacter congonensis]|uniref:Transposase n=1 Tax=Phoenicibacter congonensis TaxID=1944646 RepID=A0AA43RJ43_9ACTN|nr:transposase [Phoenicibacter congonensis]